MNARELLLAGVQDVTQMMRFRPRKVNELILRCWKPSTTAWASASRRCA